MTPEEKQTLNDILYRLDLLEKPDRFTFRKSIYLDDGRSINFGTVNGGTIKGKKLSVYGVTPVAQQAAITAPSGGATIDAEARTAISDLITRIKNFGITL